MSTDQYQETSSDKNIINKKKIGIIADYDVDGSTSAALLHNFFSFFKCSISLKIPDRLNEGYGPNKRIMDEFTNEKINLVFSLDCGTTSFEILDHPNYKEIDVIIIDHHISENKLPNIYSIINPNRFDDNSKLLENYSVVWYRSPNNTIPIAISFPMLLIVGGAMVKIIGSEKFSKTFSKYKNFNDMFKALWLYILLWVMLSIMTLKEIFF